MKFINNLKLKAEVLNKEISAIYYAYRNPETGLVPKLVILFALGYALSPIDLIPDFIPVLGYLDDLIIVPALISFSIKLIPQKVIDESRARAEIEPVKPGGNWFFAFIFICIWVALFVIIILKITG